MLIPALTLVATLTLGLLGLYGALQLTRPARCIYDDTAERWGLPEPEPVWLQSRDGLRLAAWWFAHPRSRASVVVCHGHGGDKRTSLWVAADLYPRSLNVLLLDLRGHGESDGDLTSVGYLERLDVLGAVDWIVERLGVRPKTDEPSPTAAELRSIDGPGGTATDTLGSSSAALPGPTQVGVLGISMGGAAAIQAAAESLSIGAVIADSPFARLCSPVREAICARGYPRPLSPVLAWSVCTVASWLGSPRGPWRDPIDVIGRIAPRPLLLIHGEADDLIPVENAFALYHRAGRPAELWVVPEVGHARAAEVDPSAYSERVGSFFERWLAGSG